MYNQLYTEADWKLFRKKIGTWQSSFIQRLNQEYIELLKKDSDPAENFWELNKRIQADKRKVGVIAEMRRSKLIENLVSLIHEGVICLNDLAEFSDVCQATIRELVERSS